MALIRTGEKTSPPLPPREQSKDGFDISKVPFRTARELCPVAEVDDDTAFAIGVALLSLTSDTVQRTTNWQLNALLNSHRGIHTNE